MNNIERLTEYVKSVHPHASVTVTRPLRRDGIWSLDIDQEATQLAVEWSEQFGFGISTVGPDNFGEKPDEAFSSLDEAQRRVSQLLVTDDQTSPSTNVLLSRLRERKGFTQQQLATKLRISQATVSGIERRKEIQLNTLRRYIEALGGEVEIIAVFPEGRYSFKASLATGLDFSEGVESVKSSPRQENVHGGGFPCDTRPFVKLQEVGGLKRAYDVASAIREYGFGIAKCEQ